MPHLSHCQLEGSLRMASLSFIGAKSSNCLQAVLNELKIYVFLNQPSQNFTVNYVNWLMIICIALSYPSATNESRWYGTRPCFGVNAQENCTKLFTTWDKCSSSWPMSTTLYLTVDKWNAFAICQYKKERKHNEEQS